MRQRLEEEKICVECRGYVPIYRKYLCEECFKDMLSESIRKEDEEE